MDYNLIEYLSNIVAQNTELIRTLDQEADALMAQFDQENNPTQALILKALIIEKNAEIRRILSQTRDIASQIKMSQQKV